MKILQFPLSRITICFAGGILFGAVFVPGNDVALLTVASAMLALVVCSIISRKKPSALYFGICVCVVSFSIGTVTQLLHSEAFNTHHYTKQKVNADTGHLIEVVLREKLKSTAKNQRFVAIVHSVDRFQSTGKLLVNIRLDSARTPYSIGDKLRFYTKIFANQPPLNPDQFDYGRYLSNKNIFASAYLQPIDIHVAKSPEKSIWYYADRIRKRILTNLQQSNFRQKELNVLAALILGQQQDISPDVLRNYQFAGAVHILSVSGLHVGFIVLFLNFGLKLLPKKPWVSFLNIVIVILGLWSFAVVAGLSPSVVRSVTMFSFVAIGMHLKRSTNIYHTLLVSIFLILLFQPSFLFDVGFQLSYIAVLAIVWLQPMLANVWTPKSKPVRYFANIFTVSIAAQLGAFPLSLYYFHQFPGLFFITNLVIIPFLGVIMAAGVLVMVIAAFAVPPPILTQFLQYCLLLLNTIIGRIASVESFILKDIPFNLQMLVTMYVLIVLLIFWIKKPSFQNLVLALFATLGFQMACLTTRWNNNHITEMIVFNVRQKSQIAIRNGGQLTIYNRDSIADNNINAYQTANFIAAAKRFQVSNTLFFKQKKILLIDSAAVVPAKVAADVVILTQSPKLNLDRTLQTFKPKIVIADGSNYKSYVALWKQTCIKKKIPFHATAEKGFYRIVD